ncbi:cytochrome P450 [Saccharopolyspora taberi]|uniref:Cytochrome P450 n=1 Tax=Saccharopolyspora taberi TaxID=60895 RepID=A0ABN3VAE0_9PSEU
MTVADRWQINPQHFWMRGEQPEHPVSFDREKGFWNVYGYPEALEILSNPKVFSSDTSRLSEVRVDPELTEGNLVQMDDPGHGRLRRLVSHAFTPKIVNDLAPRIAELTHELLDEHAGRDRIELVSDLAYPLPVIVIAELLGVPSSDRHLFKEWAEVLFDPDNEITMNMPAEEQRRRMQEFVAKRQSIRDYFLGHAAERRTRPREDLLTQLVRAEVDGERLTDDQVVNFANLLLLAGHITTTLLLGNTVLCLDAHPDQAERVRADRSLVPTAIEESVRFLSPFALVARATNTDVEIAGTPVPRDQLLLVWVAAANRDPRQFADPHAFDIGRAPGSHLGFGRGVHFCLGAPLARLEGRIVLDILLDRFPKLRTDPDNPPVFRTNFEMNGVRELPLVARSGPAASASHESETGPASPN